MSSASAANNESETKNKIIQMLFDMGNTYVEKEKYANALDSFTKIISLDPSNFEAYNLRAALHSIMKNYKASVNDAQRVIELNPKSGQGYFRAAIGLTLLGELHDAWSVIEAGMAVDPKHKQLNQIAADLQSMIQEGMANAAAVQKETNHTLLPVTVLSGTVHKCFNIYIE